MPEQWQNLTKYSSINTTVFIFSNMVNIVIQKADNDSPIVILYNFKKKNTLVSRNVGDRGESKFIFFN